MSEAQPSKYSFSYVDPYNHNNSPDFPLSKEVFTSVLIHDDASITTPIREFVQFLSSIYGWDVSKKVAIKDYRGEFIPLEDM